jgi:hypothetical protein
MATLDVSQLFVTVSTICAVGFVLAVALAVLYFWPRS